MDLRYIDIPKIEDNKLFEELCRDLFKRNENYINVNINGRLGQTQDGVDVFAKQISDGNWIGLQSKVRSTNKSFTENELRTEVNMAKKFNPKISQYYLYTTLDRDGTTQELVRKINDELLGEGLFTFDVKFWPDIEETLKSEIYHPVYIKYYRAFFRDNTSLGHSIGKLMNLQLGIDRQLDTHYELILGKVPHFNNTESYDVDYYRGTYFIVNLHEKTLEFFTPKEPNKPPYCYDSDIRHAFGNKMDCFRITKWLNRIPNLDDFIYNDQYTNEFYLTKEEDNEFLNSGGD